MERIYDLFRRNLFLLFLLVLLGSFLSNLDKPAIGTYGVNKTVNWAYSYDLAMVNSMTVFVLNAIFIVAYFILFLSKRSTNLYLSIAQFVVFIIVVCFENSPNVIFALNFISLFIFVTNVTLTLSKRKCQTRS